MTKNHLWLRWTGANALAEMFGLGLTFAITGWFFSSQGNSATTAGILLSFAVAVFAEPWKRPLSASHNGGRCISLVPGYQTILVVARHADRRVDRLRAGLPAIHVDGHGCVCIAIHRSGRAAAVGCAAAGCGDGSGWWGSVIVCPMAGPARKGEARRPVDFPPTCWHGPSACRSSSGASIRPSSCLKSGSPCCSWRGSCFWQGP